MIFTVNIVDWQQSRLDSSHSVSNQVWKNTMMMLDILRKNEIIGTFFIHDKVATKYPVLVRKIMQEGHEIACLIDNSYRRKTYKQVAQLAVQDLEDIIDKKVVGIRTRGLHLLQTHFDHYCHILEEIGIQYDSSLITNLSINQYEKKNTSIAAFADYNITEYPQSLLLSPPLSGKYPMPLGGKAFRLLPYECNNLLASHLNRQTSVFSLSVYDLGFADYASTKNTFQLSFSHKLDFINRRSLPKKIQKLFGDYPFDSFANYYRLENR